MTEPDLQGIIQRQMDASDDTQGFGMNIYRIMAPEGGGHEFTEQILGIVAEFPNGGVYADWNIDAWPDETQLQNPHVSIYGSIEDLERVAEGTLEHIREVDAYP